jgi:NAD(P)-dependent dehydrogenase (short-subunit alcohol dehydrogenase family)
MPKVWLITGSSRGLGRALAEAVLTAGDKLVASARNPEHLADLVERFGDQVRAVALDVTNDQAATLAVAVATEAFGRLDVLAKEVEPFGIKVTIIEPGGFRTDFAGSSTAIREGRSEYDATVGKTARFQRDYNGKQPGDPAKAAAAVLHIVSLDDPPLRLLLGSDAVRFVEQNDLAKMESDRKWKELSISTDIELESGPDS